MPRVRSRHHQALLLVACLLATLAVAGCEREETTVSSGIGAAQARGPAVIVSQAVEAADEPLLLLDDPDIGDPADDPAADNSRCFVCHINYATEELAVNHARRNIGCAHCHGASDAHIADESWGSGGNGTAPDIMYPRDKVTPACMACHPKDKIDAPHHEPAFLATDARVCTDCHGDHRLATRRCKWR
jgi:hypothetical protein